MSRYFTPSPARQPDPHRKDREEAKRMAAERGIEIEQLKGGGFNVWPPRDLADADDAFHGDHHCSGWAEVCVLVRTYWGQEVK